MVTTVRRIWTVWDNNGVIESIYTDEIEAENEAQRLISVAADPEDIWIEDGYLCDPTFETVLWSSFCTIWIVLGITSSPYADHYLTDSQRTGD